MIETTRSIGQVDEYRIGGKRARTYVYREYLKQRGMSGPIAFPWEIWIDGEGIVAEGTSERDDQWKHREEVIKQLRKERRKKKMGSDTPTAPPGVPDAHHTEGIG